MRNSVSWQIGDFAIIQPPKDTTQKGNKNTKLEESQTRALDKIKKYGTPGIYILKGCHTFLFLSSRADGLNLALVYVSIRVYFEYLEEYISEKV